MSNLDTNTYTNGKEKEKENPRLHQEEQSKIKFN